MSERILDEAALNAIRALQPPGAEDLLAKIVAMFLEQQPLSAAALRQAVAEQDGAKIAALAHALKSSSANVGAMRVAAISHDIETAARSQQLDNIDLILVQLESELEAAILALRELLPTEAVANG